jgi:hypothetical protein
MENEIETITVPVEMFAIIGTGFLRYLNHAARGEIPCISEQTADDLRREVMPTIEFLRAWRAERKIMEDWGLTKPVDCVWSKK